MQTCFHFALTYLLKYIQFVLFVPAFFVVEIFVLLNYNYKVYSYHVRL